MATPPFPYLPFPFLSFLFSPPLSTLPSPPRRAAYLNPRGFGEGRKFPQQEPQTRNKLLNVLTNTTNFGETIPLTPHSNYWGEASPGIAAHVCKQELLLEIAYPKYQHKMLFTRCGWQYHQSLCILSKNPTTRCNLQKILLCTLCRKTWYFRPRMDTEHYSLWGPPTRSLPLDLAGGLPSQDPLPRPLNVRHKSPPLWQILSDFNNSFTVATQCTLKSTTTPQIC